MENQSADAAGVGKGEKMNHYPPETTETKLFPEVCAECENWNRTEKYQGICDLDGNTRRAFSVACPVEHDKVQVNLLSMCPDKYQEYKQYIAKRMWVYHD